MHHLLLAVCAVLAILMTSQARAGGCTPGQNPFADVPDGSVFCTEALWMRNALVTVGCGNGSIYCGTEAVTRAQMALFMKRLARAVTPDTVYSGSGSTGDVDTGLATCTTTPYTVPPSNANVRTMLSAVGAVSFIANGNADVYASIEMSTNGGLFTPLGTPLRVFAPANQSTAVPVLWSQTITGGSGALLVPGSSYQWRVLLLRATTGTTGEVTETRCNLLVTLPVDATLL
jgi:hypothetical protein